MNNIKLRLNQFKRWYKLNTRTREARLEFALAALFFAGLSVALLIFIVLFWKIFAALGTVFIIAAVITSPIWIWILRGQKR